MRSFVVPLTAMTALTAFALIASPPTTIKAQSPEGEGPRAADAEPAPFNPQLSALMSMLIQPRHAKLGLAGKAENWPLAGYMFQELKQGFAVSGRAVPRWKGLPVPDLFEAAVAPVFSGARLRHQGGRAAAVRRGLREAHARLQQLPRHHRSRLCRDQVPTDAAAWPNQDFKPAAR